MSAREKIGKKEAVAIDDDSDGDKKKLGEKSREKKRVNRLENTEQSTFFSVH